MSFEVEVLLHTTMKTGGRPSRGTVSHFSNIFR